MSDRIYADLRWLPRAPADFSAQCRRAARDNGDDGKCFQALASYALDENQLNLLARAMAQCKRLGHTLAPLAPFRLGIISNATSHPLAPALIATAARHGFALECVEAGFGQLMQEVLAAGSAINSAGVDAVLLAIDHRGLPL